MSIEIITPSIFANLKNIRAFFTLKNAPVTDAENERATGGLNLGYNTNEAPEIIKKNRSQLVEAFNLNPEWMAFANQVHGNRIKVVTQGGTYAETDGLVTQVPGLALAIQVADCAAVLIAETKTDTIAAIHVGWRGAAGDIVPEAVGNIQRLGTEPKNCKAFISPCISQKNFEVGREVAKQFPDRFVDYKRFEKPHVNLKAFIQYQLETDGLEPKNIETHPDCTIEQSAKYYSHRREKEQSGRMMAIIQIKPEAL